MSSILTNSSAMNALATMRNINNSVDSTQNRISTGLKVNSAKDNAAYFAISQSMKGDSSAYSSINEGLTLTKNSVATARLGAENFEVLAKQFEDRLSFAQGAKGGFTEIESELGEIVKQMTATVLQATFNGDDMVGATAIQTQVTTNGGTPDVASVDGTTGVLTATTPSTATRNVVTGVTRSGGFGVTTMEVDTVDLGAMLQDFNGLADSFAANAGDATNGEAFLAQALVEAEGAVKKVTAASTSLGLSEKSIENQQEFLNKLTDNIDAGVGSMIDANMEEEAARLQALQVQQQLATQSLSMANQKPQNILSLFR